MIFIRVRFILVSVREGDVMKQARRCNKDTFGRVQWLMPVIPALSEVGGSPEVGSSTPAWPTWRNPIATKNTKLARRGGTCL